ncbi:hypothetical protein K1T71_013399 [Dendrolimus kikuchii]|uniref:Uncharacterized protein n=1 Tax=Dendrolimus kikuchii TaxID=765133 RepID=A0ACC1CHY4_9NEOP|nr:hypothetical protein K1T71_013399 [Dendrolimus kikuchii]
MDRIMSPFYRQCFVTLGVTSNVAQFGMVMAFTAVLLPQLKTADSTIQVDTSTGSWIASVPGVALIIGNFTIPTLMSKFGRKIANIVSIVVMIIGWGCIVFATNISMLIIARLLQGLSMGMSTSLGPILIGEYTSPKNRGAFLTTMGLSMSTGTLIVHTVGSYMTWQWTALICTILTFADLLIVVFSPESPSWLADTGRYEQCRRVFKWLRGDEEDDELNKMIEANKTANELANGTAVAKSFGSNLIIFKLKKLYISNKNEFRKSHSNIPDDTGCCILRGSAQPDQQGRPKTSRYET